jgi:ABC-type uncharacterized transport system permease subunit
MTTRDVAREIIAALLPPALDDMRKRAAAAAKAAGASDMVVARILEVPLEAPTNGNGVAPR